MILVEAGKYRTLLEMVIDVWNVLGTSSGYAIHMSPAVLAKFSSKGVPDVCSLIKDGKKHDIYPRVRDDVLVGYAEFYLPGEKSPSSRTPGVGLKDLDICRAGPAIQTPLQPSWNERYRQLGGTDSIGVPYTISLKSTEGRTLQFVNSFNCRPLEGS